MAEGEKLPTLKPLSEQGTLLYVPGYKGPPLTTGSRKKGDYKVHEGYVTLKDVWAQIKRMEERGGKAKEVYDLKQQVKKAFANRFEDLDNAPEALNRRFGGKLPGREGEIVRTDLITSRDKDTPNLAKREDELNRKFREGEISQEEFNKQQKELAREGEGPWVPTAMIKRLGEKFKDAPGQLGKTASKYVKGSEGLTQEEVERIEEAKAQTTADLLKKHEAIKAGEVRKMFGASKSAPELLPDRGKLSDEYGNPIIPAGGPSNYFANLVKEQESAQALAKKKEMAPMGAGRERSLARQVFAKELTGDLPGALTGAEGNLLNKEATARARKLGLSDDQVAGFLKKELAKSIEGDLSADADFYKKGENLGRFQQIKKMGTSLGVGADKLEKFIGGIESRRAKDASGKGFPSKEKYEAQRAELARRHSARMGDSVNLMTGKRGQSGLDYLERNTNLGEDTMMGQQRKVLEANAQARKLKREQEKRAKEAARVVAQGGRPQVRSQGQPQGQPPTGGEGQPLMVTNKLNPGAPVNLKKEMTTSTPTPGVRSNITAHMGPENYPNPETSGDLALKDWWKKKIKL